MAAGLSIGDFLALSVAERILLVEDIWDSIASVPEAVKLTEAQRRELDARLALDISHGRSPSCIASRCAKCQGLDACHRDPAAGSPWEAVKARISRRP